MGAPEINQFLPHLVTHRKISASTENQVLSTLLFLYRHILHVDIGEASLNEFRPQRGKIVPTVLSKDEVKRVINNLTGVQKLIAQVMYGGGLRVMETMRLRIKDIDFDNQQIIVRDAPFCLLWRRAIARRPSTLCGDSPAASWIRLPRLILIFLQGWQEQRGVKSRESGGM